MSVWWVNLGQRMKSQIGGRQLWCPHNSINKKGETRPAAWHWENIVKCEVGDVIVLAKKSNLVGVAVVHDLAKSNAIPPDGFIGRTNWSTQGWGLSITPLLFKEQQDRSTFISGLFAGEEKYRPFRTAVITKDENGVTLEHGLKGNEIYLTRLQGADASILLERVTDVLEQQAPGALDAAIQTSLEGVALQNEVSNLPQTQITATIQARLGQGKFRDELIDYWGGRCCATKLSHLKLLRASHIFGWAASSPKERLDKFNGLLLSAAYDAAFDAHLITLADNGNWMVAAHLFKKPDQLRQAGFFDLSANRVDGLTPAHWVYLSRHRKIAEQKWGELVDACAHLSAVPRVWP